MRNNPEDSKKLLPKVVSISEDIAMKTPYMTNWEKTDEINKTSVQRYADFLADLKLLNSKIDTSKLFYET